MESALDIYREIIKDNIDYDILILDNGMEKDRIDEIVDIMLETVCTARKSVRIVSTTGNKADQNGGRKKYNEYLIEICL